MFLFIPNLQEQVSNVKIMIQDRRCPLFQPESSEKLKDHENPTANSF